MQKLHLIFIPLSLLLPGLTGCDSSNDKKTTDNMAASDQSTTLPAHLDDILLKREVATAIQREPLFNNGDIMVSSLQGQITLEGSVDNQAAIVKAADITRKVPGVTFVTNKLTVKALDN
jgi:osmotically-inducible protein OsmY